MSTEQNPQSDPKSLPTDANKGRESNGRFAKGNVGGPGNPYARQTAKMRQAMLDNVDEKDMANIVRKMVQQAVDGNVPAARFVFEYVIGKPVDAVNPDTLDQEEFDGFKKANGMYAEAAKMVLEPDSKLPVSLLRGTREGMFEEIKKILVPMLKKGTRLDPEFVEPKANGGNGEGAPKPNGSIGGADTGGQAASGIQATGHQPIPNGGSGVNRVNRHGEGRLTNGGNGGNRLPVPSSNGKLHSQ